MQALRITVTIMTFLIGTSAFGQLDKLKGTWISNSQDVMIISDTLNREDYSNMLCTADKEQGMAFYIIGDTLSFQKKYYSSENNYKKLNIDRFDMIVLNLTDTSITVRPASRLSKT